MNTGISQSLSYIFLLPIKTICFCFTVTTQLLSRIIVQLLSAICPRDISNALFKSGITDALIALEDNNGNSGILPSSVDFITKLFGKVILGPLTFSQLNKAF